MDDLAVANLVINHWLWISLEDILKAFKPTLKVLRLVDSEMKSCMSYLKGYFLGVNSNCQLLILQIIFYYGIDHVRSVSVGSGRIIHIRPHIL